MEFRQLRYLIAAADHGSFRRAAVVLGVQESTVSRGIRSLEDSIGVDLFNRRPTGVVLTHAGQRLLAHARMIAGQVGDAAREAGTAGRGEEGVVGIGIIASLVSGFLAELLRLFSAGHPGVRVELIEGLPAEHIAAVQQYRLDIAFIVGIPAVTECDVAHLWSERAVVALPEQHPLLDRDVLGWEDLYDQHFLVSEMGSGPEQQDYIVRSLGKLGYKPRMERCSVGRDNLLQLVALGRGLSISCEATMGAVFPGVVYRHLDDENLPFSAVWSSRNANPALRRLLSLARILAKRP